MTILWYFWGLVPWSDFPSVQCTAALPTIAERELLGLPAPAEGGPGAQGGRLHRVHHLGGVQLVGGVHPAHQGAGGAVQPGRLRRSTF